jgi:NitT/TauT family transport system permease protein/taurine transport system permease protein
VLVPYFQVNPRLFPQLGAVVETSIEAGRDGTLAAHVAASLTRVMLGTTPWRCSLPFRSA